MINKIKAALVLIVISSGALANDFRNKINYLPIDEGFSMHSTNDILESEKDKLAKSISIGARIDNNGDDLFIKVTTNYSYFDLMVDNKLIRSMVRSEKSFENVFLVSKSQYNITGNKTKITVNGYDSLKNLIYIKQLDI